MSSRAWTAAGKWALSGATHDHRTETDQHRLQRFIDGRWTTWAQREYSGRVSGAGTVRFPQWVHYPTNQPNSRYAYRVVYVIGWFVAGTTQRLGMETIVPNTPSDNRCHTRFGLRCDSYWDGIVF